MDKQNKTKHPNDGFAVPQANVKIIAISVVLIIIGFFLVAGGKSDDPNVFNPEIFNARRLVIAPIVMMLGFLGVIYGVMKKPKA